MSRAGGGPPTVALDAYEETARVAFAQSGYGGEIVEVTELSPMVSTNHVYRLSLAGGHHLVAKVSSYGSYWLFKEDHDRLHRCRQQLHDTRYANLLADTVTKDGRVFVHRDGDLWTCCRTPRLPVASPTTATSGPRSRPTPSGSSSSSTSSATTTG